MKKRIVCFGDSNTWGYRAGIGGRFDENTRWTGRLQKLLGDEYVVVEEGQNGRTTVFEDRVENRMAGLDYLWPCMESQSPFDLIIIMLGCNDTKTYFGATARNIADGAARLVRMAAASTFGPENGHPQVLLVAPARIEFNETLDGLFGEQSAEKSKGFSREFARAAQETGCHFFDASTCAEPSPADGLHLTEESHAALAQALCREVKAILE